MPKPRLLLVGALAGLFLAAGCATQPPPAPPHPAGLAAAPKSSTDISNVDPHWSSFAKYLQRLIARVQLDWNTTLKNSAVYPLPGSEVVVKFALNTHGRIARIIKVDSTSSEEGRAACLAAITDPTPYGEWTPEMVALLGHEQEITFTFRYQ